MTVVLSLLTAFAWTAFNYWIVPISRSVDPYVASFVVLLANGLCTIPLGVTATIGAEVYRTRHRYKELSGDLVLIFFWATIEVSALLQNFEFERFEWAGPTVLRKYDFLPADKELIDLLASGSIRVD